jgi:ERCC4-type nuclease
VATGRVILVSASEPQELRALGVVSSIPERWGADVVVPGTRMVALQRKTIDDLLASLADGRLERELALLRKSGCGALLVEGRPQWSADGLLEMGRRRFTVRQWWGVLWSAALVHGLAVVQTGSLRETADCVRCLERWLPCREHRGLTVRPTPNATSAWGHATDRDWARHLLQSFPGVGPVLADAIYDRFGRAPLRWDATREELGAVDGVGPRRLAMLWEALETGDQGMVGGRGSDGAARGAQADVGPGRAAAAPGAGGAVGGDVDGGNVDAGTGGRRRDGQRTRHGHGPGRAAV